MNRKLTLVLGGIGVVWLSGGALADDAVSPPSQHQRMKECMSKEKASDGGMPKEDMKKDCKDVTKTEMENAKAEKAADSAHSDAVKEAKESAPTQ